MAFSGQSAWNSPGAVGSLAKGHNLEPCGADPEGRAGQHHSAEEDPGGGVGEHRAHHPKSPQVHVKSMLTVATVTPILQQSHEWELLGKKPSFLVLLFPAEGRIA